MEDREEQFCRDRANEIMHLSQKLGQAQARVEKLEKALKIIAHQTKDSLFATQKRVNQIAQQALRNDE